MVEAVRARAKLTTEVFDVRNYIERRFVQESVAGDLRRGRRQ